MEKLENVQTKDLIATILRKEIFSGRIADGEELTQEQLAEKLAVSRMPVREALQILTMEGLILRLPNRHMQVVGLQKRTACENMRMIAAVETEIVLIIMQYNLDAILALKPDNDMQFHVGISELAHNHYIHQIHKKLLEGYPKYIWDNVPSCQEATSLNQAILTAVKSGDESAIRESIRCYYAFLTDLLLTYTKGEK